MCNRRPNLQPTFKTKRRDVDYYPTKSRLSWTVTAVYDRGTFDSRRRNVPARAREVYGTRRKVRNGRIRYRGNIGDHLRSCRSRNYGIFVGVRQRSTGSRVAILFSKNRPFVKRPRPTRFADD